MTLREAFEKSDKEGREDVKQAFRDSFNTIALSVFIISLLAAFGLDIEVQKHLTNFFESQLGPISILVFVVALFSKYLSGFREMMQKHHNTGKLEGGGWVLVIFGGLPLVASLLNLLTVPSWMNLLGLAGVIWGFRFIGRQRVKKNRCA